MSTPHDWRRGAAGQTLAIFALMLPVMIGMVGLGADGANMYLNYRNAQSGADLGALAGARILPVSPNGGDYVAAENRAESVAASNGYSTGVTAIAPYVDSSGTTWPNHVEVLINASVGTFFLPLFSINTMDLNVRAVAGSTWVNSGGNVPAVYAGCGADDDAGNCTDEDKAIDWSGQNSEVIGETISNCTITLPGSDNEFDELILFDTGSCQFLNGGGNAIDPPITEAPEFEPWPVNFDFADFDCDVTVDGKIELKDYYSSGTTVTPGVYCAIGSSAEIVSGDSDVIALGVTLVSRGKIDISGINIRLTPDANSQSVAMWAGGSGSPTIKIAGSGSNASQCLSWDGIIYAHEGQIEISGQYVCSGAGGGSILGDRVKMNGSNHLVDSTNLNSGGVPTLDSLRLFE